MSLFPMFVKLQGRTVVVVGAGVVAEGKIPGLFAAGARGARNRSSSDAADNRLGPRRETGSGCLGYSLSLISMEPVWRLRQRRLRA